MKARSQFFLALMPAWLQAEKIYRGTGRFLPFSALLL
jgi:hypothetical protein